MDRLQMLRVLRLIRSLINLTWQVIQLTFVQSGHLKMLTSSSKIVQPAQSGVLQWKVFFMLASASFTDFFWCFSKTAGLTSYKRRITKLSRYINISVYLQL